MIGDALIDIEHRGVARTFVPDRVRSANLEGVRPVRDPRPLERRVAGYSRLAVQEATERRRRIVGGEGEVLGGAFTRPSGAEVIDATGASRVSTRTTAVSFNPTLGSR
jgi:hypothetical protein